MHPLLAVDWHAVFAPSVPTLEIIVRGSLLYLSLIVLLRVVLKREAAGVGVADLLMVVLLSDASQNAMSAGYTSLTDGLILVATIIGWNFLLDKLAFHVPWVRHLLRPPPLRVIRDGRLLRRNMRKEYVTAEELLAEARKQGIDDLTKIKEAYVEGDGSISIVPMGTAGKG